MIARPRPNGSPQGRFATPPSPPAPARSSPTHGGQSLLVYLVKHGLTCGKGYSDEPLLQGISSPTVDLERYTSGDTMAEAFYMRSRFAGWQDVVVGDPLGRPYAKR